MKNFLFLLLFAVGCASGGSLLTMNSFEEIALGTSAPEVIATLGQPYAIHKKEDGALEYEYIERFKVGDRNLQERRYYLLIKEGKVAAKRYRQSSPPGYVLDSYDMQTTQQEDASRDTP